MKKKTMPSISAHLSWAAVFVVLSFLTLQALPRTQAQRSAQDARTSDVEIPAAKLQEMQKPQKSGPIRTKAYVGNYNGNSISIVDLDLGMQTATVSTGNWSPRGMVLSFDHSTLYAVAGPTIVAVDTASDTATTLATDGSADPFGIAITPDGSKLYIANGNDFSVSVRDAHTGTLIATIPTVRNPVYTAMHPAGDRLYVTTSSIVTGDTMISVIDTATNTVDHIIETPYYPAEISVIPDGSLLFVSNELDAHVSVFDTTTDSLVTTIQVNSGPRGITFTPDGQTAYVANADSNMATAIDVTTLTVIHTANVPGFPFMFGVSHDGRTFVTQYLNNALGEVDFSSGQVVESISVGTNPYNIVTMDVATQTPTPTAAPS
ncbi:MAG: beta-propeller fold lactonase family protein, partial [Verrucomicrobia bacterium]|nr:beta-propeller fold lactonase family protein [Verrucomicrobiota bacterium]